MNRLTILVGLDPRTTIFHLVPRRARHGGTGMTEVSSKYCLLLSTEQITGPLDKLSALLTDIFEAEDSIGADIDVAELDTAFFSTSSTEACRPHLHPNMIRKLSKYIGYVCRPGKRARGVTSTPRRARIGEVDTGSLSRILKILERSVKQGEDLDPFNWNHPHVTTARKSVSPKKQRVRKRSKSKTPVDDGEEAQEGEDDVSDRREPTALDLEKVTTQMERARDSMLAAECCITVLGADRLPKQVRLFQLSPLLLLNRCPALFGRTYHVLSERCEERTEPGHLPFR